eukprot:2128316-Pleurochrysis_carterae.AAC.1
MASKAATSSASASALPATPRRGAGQRSAVSNGAVSSVGSERGGALPSKHTAPFDSGDTALKRSTRARKGARAACCVDGPRVSALHTSASPSAA